MSAASVSSATVVLSRRCRFGAGAAARASPFASPAAEAGPSASPCVFLRSALRRIEFHRFLIALSVRPGKSLTISDQRVPSSCTFRMMAASSSTDQSDLSTSGLRWLCHRSRHCFPERPTICLPTALQRILPPSAVIAATSRSSCASWSAFQMCFFQVTEVGAPGTRFGVGPVLVGCGEPPILGVVVLQVLGPVGAAVRLRSSRSVASDTSIDSDGLLPSGMLLT
eukprot:scaffold3756_cov60-Phaeocystis_antarctica.AAC.2